MSHLRHGFASSRTGAYGVGFDQLLLVDEVSADGAGASYRIFNADGGEVEQCGNGARCVASFLAEAPGEKLSLTSRGRHDRRPKSSTMGA